MLQTILHQLWNQRRQNGWIFLELLVVSFFLWTVIDPIYVLTANHAIDRGYDPEGLYVVNIGMYDETNGHFDPDMASDSMNLVAYTRLARIVREQPEVDSWAIAGNQSFPNSSSWIGTQVFADTASLHREEGYVHAQRYEFVTLDGSNLLRTYGMKDVRTGGDIRLPEQPEGKVFLSERLARLLFGTADAVGKKVYQSDEPLDEGASQADLEAAGAARNDIYLASATFDYQYGAELYTLGLERTKGNLLIKAEGIPDNINFSMKTIDDIFSTVTSDFEYSNLTQVSTELEWEVRNEIQSETLLCPSPGYEGSTLSVTFVDHDAVSGIAGRATETASVLTPEDVNITMGRNEITILKYVYDAQQEDFKIYVRVNDNWEQWHGMELD